MPTKKSNIIRLKALINKRSPTRAQQEQVVKDYEERKIANYLTAENAILKLQSSNKKVVQKALQEILKYENAQPVTGKLTRDIEEKKRRFTKKMSEETQRVNRLNKEEEQESQPSIRIRNKRTETEAEKQRKPVDVGKVKIRITKKMKEDSANKIRNRFLQFRKPKVRYYTLERAMSVVEISVSHLKNEEKNLMEFLDKNRKKTY